MQKHIYIYIIQLPKIFEMFSMKLQNKIHKNKRKSQVTKRAKGENK